MKETWIYKTLASYDFFFIKFSLVILLVVISQIFVKDDDKMDVAIFIIGLGFSLLLINFELRKSRELDVYNKTFESLIVIFRSLDETFGEIPLKILDLYSLNNELKQNSTGNYLITRPLGDDFDALDTYCSTLDFLKKQERKVEQLCSEIYFLSLNFKDKSDSKKLLMGINKDIGYFMKSHYSKLILELQRVEMNRFIDPEIFDDLFPTSEVVVNNASFNTLKLYEFNFKIDNKSDIMKHFNRNDFN